MKTTTCWPPTTSGAIFQWQSLKTRVTIFMLAIFLVGIWSLAFYSSYTLQKDMEKTLGEQQFSTVSIIAAEINTGLDDRMKALEQVAALITPAMLANAATIQTFIEGRPAFSMMFNGGIFVLLPDGTAIADFPLTTGRRGINFMDRKYAIGALKEGKTTIGSPVMGKALKSTLFSIATPIHDIKGKVIGALTGTVDLAKPNFLSRITDNSYGKTGGYLLIAPKIRTIVFATDKKRIMEVLPAKGKNLQIDRNVEGFEGFTVLKTPYGEEVLSASKKIPAVDWIIASIIPTREAFAPIHTMQKRMLLATIFLTLLAGGLTWWMLKRQLAPVFTTIRTLAALSDSDQPPQPLPITRQDEIGELIGGFNHLMETLEQRDGNLRFHSGIMQNMVEGVYLIRVEDGKIVYANPRFERMFGYDPGEMIGKDVSIVNAPGGESPEETKKTIVDILLKSGEWHGEVENIKKDGTHFWSYANVSLFEHSQYGKVFLSVHTDITERKRAEGQLREMTARLRLATDSAKAGVWDWDLQTNEMIWDNRMHELYGLTHENFPGGIKAWEQRLHPDDAARAIEECQAALRGEKEFDTEFRVKHPNGNIVYIKASGLVLRDNNGKPLRMIGLNSDISDRRKAQEERKVFQERLQRAEKMESLGTLAGGVAHDLNNVLGIIVGYAEMVLDGTDKSSPNLKSLENIMNGGMKAAAIVEDLLTLARRGVQGRAILNINTFVADCQKSPEFANLLSHHPSVNIITDLEPDLLNISGSAVHLGKSLYNLISNASEAMPKGGTVTIRTIHQYLDKPIQGYDQIHSGDYVVLSVSDTGEGISEHDMKRIFEPFYTKKIMGRSGTGLGLAVVWGTVKDHNGYINVQSEEDKGTTFTLYFPVTREDITTETAAVPSSEYMGKGERILVVDDMKEQRDLAASLLTTLNYNVSSVSSGEGAVKHLKEQNIDLIVLDMIMDPGMDGLDTYRQVMAISPKQKAIIVSGYSESDRVKEARGLGVGAYLKKPYIKEKLGVAVRKELDRK